MDPRPMAVLPLKPRTVVPVPAMVAVAALVLLLAVTVVQAEAVKGVPAESATALSVVPVVRVARALLMQAPSTCPTT